MTLLALGRRNPNDAFGEIQYGLSGNPGQRRGEWRKSSARESQPASLRASFSSSGRQDEVPVGHVTNGVHVPTWDSAPADDLWTEACGKERWLGTMKTVEQDIRRVSDADLWQFRLAASKSLVAYARERLSRQLALIRRAARDDPQGKSSL